jgi:hypothetical protein
MPNDSTPAAVSDISLKTMRLRPGMSLQVQRAGQDGSREAQFLAAIDGKGVMVGPHATAGATGMKAGEDYLVRGFTGQYDFAFGARVIQTFEEPFIYALLAYPPAVQARLVRRAMRMKTSVPALATPEGAPAATVTVIDLSVAGAMIKSPAVLGGVGAGLTLAFAVDVDKSRANLSLPTSICHSSRCDSGEGYNIGLAFKAVSTNDKLVLNYLMQSAE